MDSQIGSLLPSAINAELDQESQKRHQRAGASQSGSKLPHSKG
jgi:hypothetical protein